MAGTAPAFPADYYAGAQAEGTMNKKGYTRKPVIRGPLPEKDKITLCELVTWRAIGMAWPARRLKGLMKRNRGQRKPTFLWEFFEREAATVVSLCGKGDLSPNGSVDGNPHQPFSEGYFLSDVYADYVSDSIGPDPSTWPRASPYPDENPEEPRELPTYCAVRFPRSDLLSFFGQSDQPAAETAQAPAGGAQDDAALALEMVSARGTEVKPEAPAVLPEPAIEDRGDDDNAAAPQKTKKEQKVLVGRKKGQGSLAQSDEPLIQKMHKLIAGDEEEASVLSAADQFAGEAKGAGTEDSKRDRLRKRYREVYPLKKTVNPVDT